ncbi:hypothetical protein AB1L88_26755 [Tautonia sp. JC769]|uniref:hypothetical protein n=1 Tax=Tautonia sp. JC769 TaxID=3232135 RepID=UPI0034579F3E
MRRSERERRLQIIATNYGRDAGWIVEYRGRPVAELTDPRFADMFWYSYRVEPRSEEPAERESLLTSPDRWLACEFVYRNRQFGLVAENAFPAGGVFPESGRILMRALYLDIDSPTVWERLLLWLRGSREAAWNA